MPMPVSAHARLLSLRSLAHVAAACVYCMSLCEHRRCTCMHGPSCLWSHHGCSCTQEQEEEPAAAEGAGPGPGDDEDVDLSLDLSLKKKKKKKKVKFADVFCNTSCLCVEMTAIRGREAAVRSSSVCACQLAVVQLRRGSAVNASAAAAAVCDNHAGAVSAPQWSSCCGDRGICSSRRAAAAACRGHVPKHFHGMHQPAYDLVFALVDAVGLTRILRRNSVVLNASTCMSRHPCNHALF